MMDFEIKGIIPPVLTPMHADESVNYQELERQIDRLLSGGVHGIFAFGTNGEGYALNQDEKACVLKTVVDRVAGRVPVYAGTGCILTRDTVRQSVMAQELGADVLSIITPSFAQASQHELYEHYMEVAAAVPKTPIILYNIPARTGNMLAPETVRRLALDAENIVGVKDSSGDFDNMMAYYSLTSQLGGKKFTVLSGNDALILPLLKAGGAGGIAGCANVYPRIMSSIYDHYMAGDVQAAEEAQNAIVSLRNCFQYGNSNTVVKAAVRLMGYDVGLCRKPFSYISYEGLQAIKRVLEENQQRGMQ